MVRDDGMQHADGGNGADQQQFGASIHSSSP
jgi:hypothetical protein